MKKTTVPNLAAIDTRAPEKLDKQKTKEKTRKLLERLRELQAIFYADNRFSLLIVLQGMDASGKDGAVRRVFSGVNPMGCRVKAFKVPTEEEKSHDFLWRVHNEAPPKGMFQIFNRSHYEDVLVPRVHQWADEATVRRRYKHINAFEQLLADHGTQIFKFYLHISRKEQKERFAERIENPEKRWKYKGQDLIESDFWDHYMEAYTDIFRYCQEAAPWHIVPSDQNWYKDYLIAQSVVERLERLNLRYPGFDL